MEKTIERRAPVGMWQRLVAVSTLALGSLMLWHALGPFAPGPAGAAIAVTAAAVLELGVGLTLAPAGHGAVYVFAGAVAVCLAAVFGACALACSSDVSGPLVALGLGLACVSTGAMRGIDLAIVRYGAGTATVRAIDCAFRLMLGAWLLTWWQVADGNLLALAVALQLVAAGLALSCTGPSSIGRTPVNAALPRASNPPAKGEEP